MKKILIIITTLLTLSIILFLLLIPKEALLKVKINQGTASISIDDKTYEDKTEIEVKLNKGNHKIEVVETLLYQGYSKEITLKSGEIKYIEIELNESEDSRQMKKITEDVTNKWISYRENLNNNFLEEVKIYISKDVYDSLKFIIDSSNKTNKYGGKMLQPMASGPIEEIKLTNTSTNRVEAYTYLTKKEEKDLASFTYVFNKLNKNWVIVDIKYYY